MTAGAPWHHGEELSSCRPKSR